MAAANYSKYIALQDHFAEHMRYAADEGVVVWRDGVDTKNGMAHARRAGQPVGCITKDGYRQACIGKSTSVYLHIVAWYLHHKEWPAGIIDHINGDRSDNRMSNLRIVTHAENIQNQRAANRRNRLGVLGVSRAGQRFAAHIRKSGRSYRLGTFDTAEAAHAAYVDAKRKLHAGCTL